MQILVNTNSNIEATLKMGALSDPLPTTLGALWKRDPPVGNLSS